MAIEYDMPEEKLGKPDGCNQLDGQPEAVYGGAPVDVSVSLLPSQAWALAEKLKRSGFSECRALAVDDAEAWEMKAADDALQIALDEAGYSPR